MEVADKVAVDFIALFQPVEPHLDGLHRVVRLSNVTLGCLNQRNS